MRPSVCIDEVLHLAQALRRQRENIARESGLSTARWEVLSAAADRATVPRIARRLGHARQSVQKTADALVRDGLARYESNPHHRRSPTLRATDSGRALIERLERRLLDMRSLLGQDVDPDDLETTLLVLRALRDDLERR